MVNARRYLELNAFRTGGVIAQHLLQQRLPQPHPRLEWRNEKLFYQKLLYGLSGILMFQSPYDVAQLLAPGDPYGTVDQLRPLTGAVEARDANNDMKGGPVGPWTWSTPVGLAIAQLVEQVLIDSMYRLGPRYLAIAETLTSGSTAVDPDDIARSHPMDRFTVGPMCQPGVFAVLAERNPKKAAAKRDPKKPVTLTWVGRQNRELWNWVRASPADATVEDVSAALFAYMTTRDHETRADYYATFLTAAPPMFGIPPQWAKTFEATRDFRPAQIAGADTDPDHQIVVLGGSTQADAQALAEIGVTAPDPKAKSQPAPPHEHDNLVVDATAQASALRSMLAGWKLGDAADKTLAFLARRRADGADRAKWLPVLSAQRENLTRVSTGILQLNAAVDQMKLSKTGEQAVPLREIMRFYADATACAHLDRSCNRLIVRAATAQMALTARGLGASLHDMDMSVDMMRSGVDARDYDRKQLSATAMHLREQGTAMQTKMMRGDNVPADEIDELQIRVEETALDAKLAAVDFSLHQLESSADEAGAGLAAWFASRFSSKFRGVRDATQKIRDQISDIRFEWNKAKRNADMPDDNAEVHEEANLRKAVEAARQRFAELAKQQDINEFLREGANIVKWQQFRTACVKLAALIGISIVGGFVGGTVARGAAGMMMGTSGAAVMENLPLGGAIVARGAGLVTEAAIQSAGQSVIFDDKLGMAFLENLIMNLGSAAVLKVLGSKVEEAARLEKATQSFWTKGTAAGKVVFKETAAITGHAIMGAAMGYVAHKIVTGKEQPPSATLEEWLMQGAGIAVGRYVGRALEASHARQKLLKLRGHEASTKLAIQTERLAALARRVEANPQPKDAMELLAKRHEVLTEELKVLDDIENLPELRKQSGMNKKQLASERAAIKDQLAEVYSQGFGDVPLHLAGMKELIPGALWSGTESQILDAIRTGHESGISINAKEDPQGGKWHLEIEGRRLEIVERGISSDPSRRGAARAPNDEHSGAAERVPGSHFVGTGAGRRTLTLPEIRQHAEYATVLLNNAGAAITHSASAGAPFFNSLHNGEISIVVPNGPAVRVKFERMAGGEDVARHNYRKGENTCTVFISEKVRPEDITRAVAHELAEIQSVAAGAELAKPALREGSASEQLDAHDVGRKAEIQVLLYQGERAPTRDTATELKVLVKHLGFDPQKIGTDARAKRVLGEREVVRIDEILNKPRITIKAGEYAAKGQIVGQNWLFEVKAKLPNGKETSVAHGSMKLKPNPAEPGKLIPDEAATLDFTLDNTSEIDHRRYRIKLEGQDKLSDYVMKEATSQFKQKFRFLPSLGGRLAWDNKARFQHAYAEVVHRNPGISHQDAAQAAILNTPYGEARDKAGYAIKVNATGSTQITTGDPPRLAEVPEIIEATAKPRH